MQMFTSTRNTYQGKRYCADCADMDKKVRAELAAAHATCDLDITDDAQEIEGQICGACQRLISQVPAHLSTYRLQLQVTFTVEVDLQARSATDAEYQLDAVGRATNFTSVMEDIETTVEMWLKNSGEATIVHKCQYHIGSASCIPPEQNLFVIPTQDQRSLL